jgi:GxxExxY protein
MDHEGHQGHEEELDTEAIAHAVIGAAIDVHRGLGPGLLESAYENCLVYELHARTLSVERQCRTPLRYKDVILDCAFRVGLLVERQLVVEVKSVERLMPVHTARTVLTTCDS